MSKPKSIFILRHGQSIGNIDWRNYLKMKDHEIPLTTTGEEQAIHASKNLKRLIGDRTVATYSSHYTRAQQTLKIIHDALETRVKFTRTDPDMRELKWMGDDLKIDRGIQLDQRKKMESFHWANSGGESAKNVHDRMEHVVNRLHEDFKIRKFPETAVLVSHGIAMRVFLMRFLGWPPETYETLDNPDNCKVFQLDLNSKKQYDLITPFPRK